MAIKLTAGEPKNRIDRAARERPEQCMNRQLFQYHPTIGYQFVPGLKARVEHEAGGYLLRTNQVGFRCRHEFAQARRAGTLRMLLFGDSYTAGDGVSDKYRYAEVLERLVPGLEVYNFGLPGSGTDQQYLIWREFAQGIEHDLVVVSVLVENIRRVIARYRPFLTPDGEQQLLAKPYYTLESDGKLALHNVPVPRDPIAAGDVGDDGLAHLDRGGRFARLRETVNRLGPGAKDRLQRWSGYQPVPGYDRASHPHWKLLEAILRQWIGEIATPVVICPIPLYQHIEETASPSGYRARFASLADPPAVIVHDPLPDFQRAPRAERRRYRFPGDCHLTPSAHELLAVSLAGCIEPILRAASTRASA
jgi:carbamoyltransferase